MPVARPHPSFAVVGVATATAGLGLVAVGGADAAARWGASWAEGLFWLGLAVVVLPIAMALWSPRPSRAERVALVVLLGMALYLIRVLYSPGAFVFFDEFSHWRTAMDISATGHLFSPNPLQPISSLYPGLEATTAMFAGLSGLPVPVAGAVVIATGRLVVVLGLFIMFERLAGSARVAGLGVLLYAANPSFVLFDSLFLYESFCLGLASVALATLAVRAGPRAPDRRLTVVACVAIAAAVATHHVTSYALVVLMATWAAAGLVLRRRAFGRAPLAAALFGIAAACFWLFGVAGTTVAYIAPHLEGGVRQVLSLIAGEGSARPLFQGQGGVTAPMWERILAYGSVGIALLSLPAGLWVIYRHLRRYPLAIALALAALLYPVSLGLRLTSLGAETAGRLSAFVFTGLAFGAAMWGVAATARHGHLVWRRLLTVATIVVFAGGVVNGTSPWSRLPYPYRPAADSRSVDQEALSAAAWTQSHLGPNHVFVTDRMDRQLLSSIGGQDAGYGNDQAKILLLDDVGTARWVIAHLPADYVYVDRRLTTQVPLVSGYIMGDELGRKKWTQPLDAAAFDKFDTMAGVSRVFDSGDVQIYDVRLIR